MLLILYSTIGDFSGGGRGGGRAGVHHCRLSLLSEFHGQFRSARENLKVIGSRAWSPIALTIFASCTKLFLALDHLSYLRL